MRIERTLLRDCSAVRAIGGCAAHDDHPPGRHGAACEEGLHEMHRGRRKTPEEMGGVGNGPPGFRSGQVKQNPMFRCNIGEMGRRRSAGGQGMPPGLTGLVIQLSAGVARAQNYQRKLLKGSQAQGKGNEGNGKNCGLGRFRRQAGPGYDRIIRLSRHYSFCSATYCWAYRI